MPNVYEPDKAKKWIINGKTVIICKTAVAFKYKNRILGTVKAEYDLSDLPSHLHERFMKMVEKTKVVKL